MDKYYEMFPDQNHSESNKKDFFNKVPTAPPDHSDKDLDSDGWTRLRRSWGLSEEEWVVCVRETSLSFIKITQALIY